MTIKSLLVTCTTLAVFLGTAQVVMAHGTKHAGGHADAVAGNCLEVIRQTGILGMGYFNNTCPYGVHVKYRVDTDQRGVGCTSTEERPYPCLSYVPANSRNLANIPNKGSVQWFACRAEDFKSDPWPVLISMTPNGDGAFGCYHMGYGPQDQTLTRQTLEQDLRQQHMAMLFTLETYKTKEVARIERKQEQERLARERREREWLAEQEQMEWEAERARQQWERADTPPPSYGPDPLRALTDILTGIATQGPGANSGSQGRGSRGMEIERDRDRVAPPPPVKFCTLLEKSRGLCN